MNASTGGRPMLMMGSAPAYLATAPRLSPPGDTHVVMKVALEADVVAGIVELGGGSPPTMDVVPSELDLARLSPVSDQPPPADFHGAIGSHRGLVSADTILTVDRVVHFAHLPDGEGERPATDLEYVVFGDADHELYLAHRILQAPDFDQILVVSITGQHFTETELDRQGRPTLTIPGRADDDASRLVVGERVAGRTAAGQHFINDVEVEVLRELRHSTEGLA